MEHQFDHVAVLARADSSSARALPDPRGAMQSVVSRLEGHPVVARVPSTEPGTDSVSVTIGSYDFCGFVAAMLGNQQGIRSVPAVIEAATRGDFRRAAAWIARSRDSRSIGSAMGYAIDCASGASQARRQRIAREAQRGLFGDVTNPVDLEACDVWGARNLGDGFRQPVRSDVEVLIISGSLDMNTPPANAENVLRGLSHAQHVIIEGATHGHAIVVGSPLIAATMLEFLQGRPLANYRITLPFQLEPLNVGTSVRAP